MFASLMILMALLLSFLLLVSSSGPAILDDENADNGGLGTAGVPDAGTIGICASGSVVTAGGSAVTGGGGTVTDDEGAVAPSTVTTNDGGGGLGEVSTDDGTGLGLETAIATGINVDGMQPAKDEGTDSVCLTDGPSGRKSRAIN